MKKFDKNSKSIVTVDIYDGSSFIFSGNKIFEYDVTKPTKSDNFVISYIPYNEIKSSFIAEIPQNTDESEIENALTIKIYEEQELDPNGDYNISYIEIPSVLNPDVRTFNVFIVENSKIKSLFSNLAQTQNYVDYIAFAPLMFKSLYNRKVISAQSCDCFIVLMEDEAYICVYENGSYVHSRPLRYSLKYISEKFSQLIAERINEANFYNELKSNGLNGGDEKYNENIKQIFEEMLYYISDVIKNVSRMQNLTINNIFIQTMLGDIPDLNARVQEVTEITTNSLKFDIAINAKSLQVSKYHALMALNAHDCIEGITQEHNFSTFLRPLPLLQRQVGKFIAVIAAALILSGAYPAFNYIYAFILSLNFDSMNQELALKNSTIGRINAKLDNIYKEQKDAKELIKVEGDKLDFRKKLLQELKDKKENYPMKGIALNDLSIIINKHGAKVSQILNTDTNLTVSARSQTDKKLTELIKEISKTNQYSVSTRQILLDENATEIYESNISIRIQQ